MQGIYAQFPAQVHYTKSGGIAPACKRQWTLFLSRQSDYAAFQKVYIVRRLASVSQKRSQRACSQHLHGFVPAWRC